MLGLIDEGRDRTSSSEFGKEGIDLFLCCLYGHCRGIIISIVDYIVIYIDLNCFAMHIDY